MFPCVSMRLAEAFEAARTDISSPSVLQPHALAPDGDIPEQVRMVVSVPSLARTVDSVLFRVSSETVSVFLPRLPSLFQSLRLPSPVFLRYNLSETWSSLLHVMVCGNSILLAVDDLVSFSFSPLTPTNSIKPEIPAFRRPFCRIPRAGSQAAIQRGRVAEKCALVNSKVHDLQRLPCNRVLMHPPYVKKGINRSLSSFTLKYDGQ